MRTMVGLGARVVLAFRCVVSLLFTGSLPDDVLDRFRPTADLPAAPLQADQGDRAVQLLAILQRDGRLVDFLEEDISSYADAQVGAAARDIQANCRAALERYLTLEPVLAQSEGERADVAGIDPARVKVLGAVTPGRAQHGVVRHRGWRATRAALPPLAAPDARDVVAPAEVEVG